MMYTVLLTAAETMVTNVEAAMKERKSLENILRIVSKVKFETPKLGH